MYRRTEQACGRAKVPTIQPGIKCKGVNKVENMAGLVETPIINGSRSS